MATSAPSPSSSRGVSTTTPTSARSIAPGRPRDSRHSTSGPRSTATVPRTASIRGSGQLSRGSTGMVSTQLSPIASALTCAQPAATSDAASPTRPRVGEAASEVAAGWAQVSALAMGESWVLTIPVEPRLSWPDPRIDAVRGTVAVERGPLVLCLESRGLPGAMDLADVGVVVDTPLEDDGEGALVAVSGHSGSSVY